jgi:hypothetical protein
MLCERAVRRVQRVLLMKARASGTFIRWSVLVVPLLSPSLASAQPNLTPYQPAGWSEAMTLTCGCGGLTCARR